MKSGSNVQYTGKKSISKVASHLMCNTFLETKYESYMATSACSLVDGFQASGSDFGKQAYCHRKEKKP